MKRFIVERHLPGAGNLSAEELRSISRTSVEVAHQMEKPYIWVESFVTDDKLICIHFAESEAVIREYSKIAKFPINTVYEVKAIIDPVTANQQ